MTNPTNQDCVWDYYQNDQPAVFDGSRARLRYLARRVRGLGRVLDIGVGSGLFEAEALRLNIEVYALDPSERTIHKLRDGLKLGDRARVGYGSAIPFDSGSFAAVVISEVIEHLTDAQIDETMLEIQRVLAPGGVLIGSVPAREHLPSQSVVCPHCEQQFHRWGHFQSFTVERMAQLTGRYFENREVRERLFVHWPLLNWKGRIAMGIKLLLHWAGVHGSGENIVFVARKRADQSRDNRRVA